LVEPVKARLGVDGFERRGAAGDRPAVLLGAGATGGEELNDDHQGDEDAGTRHCGIVRTFDAETFGEARASNKRA